jgi:hypothetical protein
VPFVGTNPATAKAVNDNDAAVLISHIQKRSASMTANSYAEPYYWAAFCFTGRVVSLVARHSCGRTKIFSKRTQTWPICAPPNAQLTLWVSTPDSALCPLYAGYRLLASRAVFTPSNGYSVQGQSSGQIPAAVAGGFPSRRSWSRSLSLILAVWEPMWEPNDKESGEVLNAL